MRAYLANEDCMNDAADNILKRVEWSCGGENDKTDDEFHLMMLEG